MGVHTLYFTCIYSLYNVFRDALYAPGGPDPYEFSGVPVESSPAAVHQMVLNILLLAYVGLESSIELHFCVNDGYRATREPADSDELLNG